MLKSKKMLLVALFLSLGLFFFQPTPARASTCAEFDFSVPNPPQRNFSCSNLPDSISITVISQTDLFSSGQQYVLKSLETTTHNSSQIATGVANGNHSITFTVNNIDTFNPGTYSNIIHGPNVGTLNNGCDLGYTYTVRNKEYSGHAYITQSRGGELCYGFPDGCLEKDLQSEIIVEDITECGEPYANKTVRVNITGAGNNTHPDLQTDANGNLPAIPFVFTATGTVNLHVITAPIFGVNKDIVDRTFPVSAPGSCTECQTTKPVYSSSTATRQDYKICDQISDTLETSTGANAKDRCIQCVGGDELGRAGIWTAIGCIPRSPEKIVNSLLRVGLGVGGGFSLIIILVSGFILSVSQGEPKRIDEAKQWLTSALVGLLFIIFSVTLLHFIGYTIFKIPGFGG